MRPELLMALLASSAACTVPQLDPAGKRCTTSCPAPFACEVGLCIEAGRLCEAWPEPTLGCFDFEGSTELTGPREVRGGHLRVDETGQRFGARSLEARTLGVSPLELARLSVPVTGPWNRLRVAFDLRVDLPSAVPGFVSLGELLCARGNYTGVWLHAEGTPTRAVARTANGGASTALTTPLTSNTWSRVSLELVRAPSLRGSIRIDENEVAAVPVTDCGGTWTVELGVAGSQAITAWYDDMVITVERE